MTRAHLPNRRHGVAFEVEHEGHRFHVCLGAYEDGGVGELFITPMGKAGKGSAVEALARDVAIIASIAIQFGVSMDLMRRAVTRDEAGRPSTLVGAVFDACEDFDRRDK